MMKIPKITAIAGLFILFCFAQAEGDSCDSNNDGFVDDFEKEQCGEAGLNPANEVDQWGIPLRWWTHQDVHMPPDTWIHEGTVSGISEAVDRIYFGMEYILLPDVEIRTIHHWDWGEEIYDGRQLTVEEFRELEENKELSESITVYALPTVDRELIADRIEFGHVDHNQLTQAERSRAFHTQYVDLFEDGLGRSILTTWWGQWDLAFDVGDESGSPLVDFDGSILQPDKMPRRGDRVRALIQNNVVIRMVRNPPPFIHHDQHDPGANTGIDDLQIGRVDPVAHLLYRADRIVHISDGTQLFDHFGLPVELDGLGGLLQPGVVIQVEGDHKGHMGQEARVVEFIENQHVEWPPRQVDRYLVGSYDGEQGLIFTVNTGEIFVAVDASITDIETGEEMSLEEIEPNSWARMTHRWNQPGEDYPFHDVIIAMELNIQPEGSGGGEIHGEWETEGRLARIEESFFEHNLVFAGAVVRVDAQTEILDRNGFRIDVEDLSLGERTYMELIPSSEPGVSLALRVEEWNHDRHYETSWDEGRVDWNIDSVEGDRIMMEGGRWSLADDVEVVDESGNPMELDALVGEMVNIRVQDTSFGQRVIQVRAKDMDHHYQPFREEDWTLYRYDRHRNRLLFAGPRARVLGPPRGKILGRHGEDISLEDLRLELDLDPQTQLIVTTRASQTGEEFATFVRVFNHEIPWEEQVPDNTYVGMVGGVDGEYLQMVDGHQPWVAYDVEVIRGDGSPAELDRIPPETEVRITIADGPPGTHTPFHSVVTRVEVEPLHDPGPGPGPGPQPGGEPGEFEGLVLEINHGERTFTLEGPQIRLDPFSTEVLDKDRSPIDPLALETGDMLAVNFVPEWPFPRATRILRLDSDVELQPRPDVISGLLLDYDEMEELLILEGPTLSVLEAAEIRDRKGARISFDEVLEGDQVRLAVQGTPEGEEVTRIKIVGGFDEPIFGGGGLEITSTFPGPEEAAVPTSTVVEVTFNEPVGGLFADEDFDFGLFPDPPEFSDLEISRDGRTILADVVLEEDTVYQLFVASERFGLFAMNFTTGDEMPAGGIMGRLALPPDVPFEVIALEESGVFLVDASIDLEELEDEDLIRGTPFEPSGDYHFENLGDGEYFVFSWVVLEFGFDEQIELFAFYDADGDEEPDPVTVEGEKVEMIDLTVLPPEPLVIEETSPEDGEVGIDLETAIEINFSDPIRTDRYGLPAIDGIILPEPLSGGLRREDIEIHEDGYMISINVELAENTAYSLLIRHVESEDGLALEEPEVVVFTTGDELPDGTIEGDLALPDMLPSDRVIRTPAMLALIPFRDFDPLNPDVENFAVAATLTSDGQYSFDHVSPGRYVVAAGVDVALPPYFRMSSSGLRSDFSAFEKVGRFGQEAPSDFVEMPFYGFSLDESGQARDDVRPDIEGIDFMLRPEDVRRVALRVTGFEPEPEVLQEAPELLDLVIEFSEPLVVMRQFVELDAFMKPEPLSGPLMKNFVVKEDGRRIAFPGVELEPGTAYRFSVGFARGVSGQGLAEPFNLVIRTAGAEELVLGKVSGAVSVEGDEISEATVFLLDPEAEGLEILAGSFVEGDGSYQIEEMVAGEYAAYVEIETVGGRDLLLFYDPDGDGEQDTFTFDEAGITGIDFAVTIEAEEPPTGEEPTTVGPNAGATVSLDLDGSAGDQGKIKLETKAEETVSLAIYGSDLTDVTGVSVRVGFDTTQVVLEEALEEGEGETHLLKSQPGAISLFLPVRLQENTAEFGGAILSPTESTAADGDGLLGVVRFSTLEGYTGASLTLDRVILNSLAGIQDTLTSELTALVAPPIDLASQPKGLFSFDFDTAAGDGELFHLGDVSTGQEIDVEVYVNEVENLTNYSVKVLYDAEQIKYVTFAEGDFLGTGGGTALGLPPLLTDNTVQFGSAILAPTATTAASGSGLVGKLTFSTTDAFTETDLLIVVYSTKQFGGEQTEIESSIFARISTQTVGTGSEEPSGPNADFSGDGVVDFNDFFMFADAFGATETDPRYDLDSNGQVDFSDFFLFADAFGKTVAKGLVGEALPRKAGRLNLEAKAEGEGLVVQLRGENVQLRGYGAIVEYDPELFRLDGVDDARSVLRDGGEALLLSREAFGQVMILGGRTAAGEAVDGLLAELHFAPLVPEAAGTFRVGEALVRRVDGRVVQPRELGEIEARWTPQVFALQANYPNPFNPSTTIRYQLPVGSEVHLEIYDVLGQKVRRLVSGLRPAGFHRVAWDSRDDGGKAVAAGVYFYRLEARGTAGERYEQVRKLLLLK